MLISTNGDMFNTACQCLVNTVNCDGVMGGGIALAFKNRYPAYFEEYRQMCREKQIRPGKVYLHTTECFNPAIIISFPTKDKVYRPSRIEYIAEGLVSLREAILEAELTSIAIPALGCGLGGLKWENVKPLIEQELSDVPDCNIFLFEPRD